MHNLNMLYQVYAKTSAIEQLMKQLSSSRISHFFVEVQALFDEIKHYMSFLRL